jgi:hypothetical protein
MRDRHHRSVEHFVAIEPLEQLIERIEQECFPVPIFLAICTEWTVWVVISVLR